ncbi:MAG: hypothetical protein VX812_05385 [Pseudomonadota bacterium]|nr:hypothetical protein [Pseudomonadota bacterium]
MKFKFLGLIIVLFLASCSTPKEEIPVAGELICTAAGVNKEECVNAVKINEKKEDRETPLEEN